MWVCLGKEKKWGDEGEEQEGSKKHIGLGSLGTLGPTPAPQKGMSLLSSD